jgi:hypothetical protein
VDVTFVGNDAHTLLLEAPYDQAGILAAEAERIG